MPLSARISFKRANFRAPEAFTGCEVHRYTLNLQCVPTHAEARISAPKLPRNKATARKSDPIPMRSVRGLTGPRVGAASPGRSARLPVQEDVVGVFEDAAQVAGVVVEEFGDREDVDGDGGGVVLGAARGDEDGGQLDLFGHAPEVALAVLGDQVAAIGHGAGGLLFLHANTPSALHARDVRGCREVRSRTQNGGRISLAGVVLAALPTRSFASARIVTRNTEKPPCFGGGLPLCWSFYTPRKESATGWGWSRLTLTSLPLLPRTVAQMAHADREQRSLPFDIPIADCDIALQNHASIPKPYSSA